MGVGTGGAVFMHVGMNKAKKEGTSAIVGKFRRLVKTLKEARIGQQCCLRCYQQWEAGEEYRNTKKKKVYMEKGAGLVDVIKFYGKR